MFYTSSPSKKYCKHLIAATPVYMCCDSSVKYEFLFAQEDMLINGTLIRIEDISKYQLYMYEMGI